MANNNKKKKDETLYTTLEFDDGKTQECIMEGVFDVDGEDYIALIPTDDSGDVYIYRYLEKDNGEFSFEDETDAAKFEAAVKEYEELKA